MKHLRSSILAAVTLFCCAAVIPLRAQNTHRATFQRSLSQYFFTPDSASLSITGDLTIEAWVKDASPFGLYEIRGIANKLEIATGKHSYSFKRRTNESGVKQLVFTISTNGTADIEQALAYPFDDSGKWTHYAAVYTAAAGGATFYMNGFNVGSLTGYPTGIPDTTAGFRIGDTFGEHHDGSMDEVRVWATARTQAQIRSTMFDELAGTESGLRGYWKLNNSLADGSGHGNSLMSVGTSFQTNDLPFFGTMHQLSRAADRHSAMLWHLDGNSNDSSAAAINGANTNTQFGSAYGKFGQGVRFSNSDGGLVTANSYIQANLPNPDDGDFTVSLWANFQNLGSNDQVFIGREQSGGTGKPNWKFTASSSYLQFNCTESNPQEVIAPISLTSNSWHHLVATRQGGVYRLYVNGLNVASNTYTSVSNCNPTSMGQIGRRYNQSYVPTQHPFNGSLDEVLIEKRAMSTEEIMKYYGGIVRAEFKSDGADGFVRKSNTNWALARGAPQADAVHVVAATGYASAGLESGSIFNLYVPHFPFDTAAIPSSGININHALLGVHFGADLSGSDGIAVVQAEQGIWNSLSVADFSSRGSVEGSTRLTTRLPSAFNFWTLNAAGRDFIATGSNKRPTSASEAGKTQLALRWGRDLDNVAPASNDFVVMSMAESGNPASLTVEYTADVVINPGSISGMVTGAAGPGGVRVLAQSQTSSLSADVQPDGSYQISGLTLGHEYTLSAYQDTNGNLVADFNERFGMYPSNPLFLNTDKTGINLVLSVADSDNDGMKDAWELINGLNVGINDSALDHDNDGLSNIHEFVLFGWYARSANDDDLDKDGVKDGAEYNTGTDLLAMDSDHDGLFDVWEMANGLNPLSNDASLDADGDGLTNAQEFNGGVNSTNPRSADTDANGVGDFEERHGIMFIRHRYDRADRLVTTLYNNGAWEGWRYDGNGNILRHLLKLARDADNDGLADAWEFAQGLAIDSSAGNQGYGGDADGDGWTNQQEFLADTAANDATSTPSTGAGSTAWATLPKSRIVFRAASGGALAHVSVRIWDAEANRAQAALQWWDATASLWKPATLSKVNNGPITNATSLTATPAGTTHDFLWNALADLPAHNGIILLRSTAQDPAGTTTSETVPYALNTAGDFDSDGIPDTYEIANGLDPNSATGNDGTTGDSDHDGYNNFAEYAFAMNLNQSDSANGPGVSSAVNPADGKTYLIYTYRRRLDAEAQSMTYTVQTSADLNGWSSGDDIEPISTAPTGDGVTETVTVRIKPPLDTPSTRKFVRIQVTK